MRYEDIRVNRDVNTIRAIGLEGAYIWIRLEKNAFISFNFELTQAWGGGKIFSTLEMEKSYHPFMSMTDLREACLIGGYTLPDISFYTKTVHKYYSPSQATEEKCKVCGKK